MTGIPIEKLGLSVRTINVLHRMEIYSIDQLLSASIENIYRQQHVGAKTIADIQDALSKVRTGEIDLDDLDSMDKKGLLKDAAFTEDQLQELSTHSIDELGLSARPYNILMRAGLLSLDKVAILSEQDIEDLKGLGTASRREVLAGIAKWLNDNKSMSESPDCSTEQEVDREIRIYFKGI